MSKKQRERLSQGICIYCGTSKLKKGTQGCEKCLVKKVEYSKRYQQKNKEKVQERKKRHSVKRRAGLEKNGVCTHCGKRKAASGRKKCRQCLRYFLEWNRKNAAKISSKSKIYRTKLKLEVIQKYGGKCNCCKIAEIEFLAIDHKNKDGNMERKALFGKNASGGSYSWYLKLRREPIRDDLQVLCYNCNIAKHIYGVCPHQKVELK